jgi:ubiquinone/menaquinone biosynthesis C-methylase UbiE
MTDAFKAFESGAWDGRARTYDLVIGAVTARVGEVLLDAVGAGAGTRLLDVGCGPGTITAAAAARGAHAVGVDLAGGMLALGRERHPALELVEGDAEELPFGDASFDAVVGGFVLNHLPSPEAAVAEAARVLAPEGRLAVAVWEPPERNRLLGELTHAVHDAGVEVRGGLPEGPDPYRLSEHAAMRTLLAAAGAAHVEVRPLRLVHRAGDADELWEGLLGGTARISTVLAAQPQDVRERVRAAFAARVAPEGGPVELEAAATIGCATFVPG